MVSINVLFAGARTTKSGQLCPDIQRVVRCPRRCGGCWWSHWGSFSLSLWNGHKNRNFFSHHVEMFSSKWEGLNGYSNKTISLYVYRPHILSRVAVLDFPRKSLRVRKWCRILQNISLYIKSLDLTQLNLYVDL